jgi:tRNA pseudouridine32 synthase/23S rRNA pseudouridine746 synthase
VSATPPAITVLARDPHLVAVAKPAGLPVVPARGEARGECLQHRLETELGVRLWVVHRIDREASGVVLFACDADTHRAASLAFEHRRVRKRYLAWTHGAPEPGAIEIPLHAARRGKTRPARPGEAGALAARTEVTVERRFAVGDTTLARVEARPASGRHHQIRVHLRAAGAPILFDPLYGRGIPPQLLAGAPAGRLALHALALALDHPATGRPLEVEAPWPDDLVALDAWLGRAGGASPHPG